MHRKYCLSGSIGSRIIRYKPKVPCTRVGCVFLCTITHITGRVVGIFTVFLVHIESTLVYRFPRACELPWLNEASLYWFKHRARERWFKLLEIYIIIIIGLISEEQACLLVTCPPYLSTAITFFAQFNNIRNWGKKQSYYTRVHVHESFAAAEEKTCVAPSLVLTSMPNRLTNSRHKRAHVRIHFKTQTRSATTSNSRQWGFIIRIIATRSIHHRQYTPFVKELKQSNGSKKQMYFFVFNRFSLHDLQCFQCHVIIYPMAL